MSAVLRKGDRVRFDHPGTWEDDGTILGTKTDAGQYLFMPDHHKNLRGNCPRGCYIDDAANKPHGGAWVTGGENFTLLSQEAGVTYYDE